MISDIFFIIVGVALVLIGADRLTDGASKLARRMRVPEIVIGLTIVACGTSMPEFFVSLMSALKGTPDLAVGNVVGSNIMNAMLIVGCAALVAPMTISPSTVKKDIPFGVFASLLLIVCIMDTFQSFNISGNVISRTDGVLLLAGFVVFMCYTLLQARKGIHDATADTGTEKQQKIWLSTLYIILGLAGLVVGSNWFVDAASHMATSLGVSESVIGLTIVAGGTSLPELATSVVAARKGQSALAIGNAIGSNVFNILLILGATAAICPMQISGITLIDVCMMQVSIALVWFFSFTRYTVARWEGAVLVAGYMVYLGWLLGNV